MAHFSSEQWADFVRNVLKEKDKEVMLAHLESGCKRCSEALNLWTRFRQAASRESAYQPPEGAVRTVKAFAASQHRPGRVRLAQLLFDSLQNSALAGARSAAAPARVMLFGIGDYRIDLRMEPGTDSKITIVGQILISADSAYPAALVSVGLVSGNKIHALMETNEFGEFSCECEAEENLRLQFTLPDATQIKIPILHPTLPHTKSLMQPADFAGVESCYDLKRKRTGKKASPKGD
ncbi:MAG TPA: hypothetical protein VMU43_10390 [Candidatus Acidoferrum sp.]|nr:hypothetical protein [Candidatus Acidoferrum sp.]